MGTIRNAMMVAALAMTGCSGADTVCGQILDNSRADWLTVSDLQEAETAFLGAVRLVVGDDRLSAEGAACPWLKGVKVMPMPTKYWIDSAGRTVYGEAYPGDGWSLTNRVPGGGVMIGADSSWRTSSIVHEWIHIVQGGVPAAPCKATDEAHCGWERPGGEYALIDALSR